MHARSVVAAAIDTRTSELRQARLSPDPNHIRVWLADLPGPVACVYEAGPTGFGLYRDLTGHGIRCEVIAPSKIIRPAGDRVKTDANDAVLLARLLRLDDITAVEVPSADREAARDLVRAREDCRGDLMSARHRVSKLLLRHGIVYSDGKAWTGAHEAWLRRQRLDLPGTAAAFDAALDAVTTTVDRRDRLDKLIARMAADSEFAPVVRRLGCLRGMGPLTSLALAVEIGDWDRFTGKTIGSFVGVVPSEHSSGGSRRQGGITKTGNGHVRRLLIESAWLHKPGYRPGKVMRDRWALASPAAKARGDAGNRRLHARWVALVEHRKRHTVANTAIARELAGWCWSLAVMND